MFVFNQDNYKNLPAECKNEVYIAENILPKLNQNFSKIEIEIQQVVAHTYKFNSLYRAYRKYVDKTTESIWDSKNNIIKLMPIAFNYISQLLECSSNKLIMGKDYDIELPLRERTLIKAYKDLSPSDKSKIDNTLKRNKSISEYNFINNPEILGTDLHIHDDDLKELMYVRFCELAHLRNIAPIDLNPAMSRKKELFKVMLENHYCSFSITNMIYQALVTDCSLDFLCNFDYTKYNQLYYIDDNGEKIYLTEDEKNTVSAFLFSSEKEQNEILAETFITSKN